MSSEFVFDVELIERELIEVSLHTIDVAPGGGTLADLNDVSLDGLINQQLLRYNSTTGKWENVTIDVVVQENSVYNESPTKLTAKQFQSAHSFMPHSLRVFLNGIKEKYITVDSSNKFSFDEDVLNEDVIEINYIKDV